MIKPSWDHPFRSWLILLVAICVFRTKPATESGAKKPPVPAQIKITDRLSRFSKIGGELVPHVKIEEVINGVLGSAASVVIAVPDAQKGERLVAFYNQNGIAAEELWERLNESKLPKLWIPKRENLHQVESIPLLGSGKVDLKKVKELAREKMDS